MRTVISLILPALFVATLVFATAKAYSQTGDSNGYVTGITSARARSVVGVAVGLVSLIIGWRVKRRTAAGKSERRSWAVTALVLGLVAVVLSIIHLANLNGDFGTGGGKAGTIVALILGLIGTVLSSTVLRSKTK